MFFIISLSLFKVFSQILGILFFLISLSLLKISCLYTWLRMRVHLLSFKLNFRILFGSPQVHCHFYFLNQISAFWFFATSLWHFPSNQPISPIGPPGRPPQPLWTSKHPPCSHWTLKITSPALQIIGRPIKCHRWY